MTLTRPLRFYYYTVTIIPRPILPTLPIRNVGDAVRARLKEHPGAHCRSPEQEAHELLRTALVRRRTRRPPPAARTPCPGHTTCRGAARALLRDTAALIA
jgi:plasmid stability protein